MVWNQLILIGNSTLIPNIPLCSYVKMVFHTKNLKTKNGFSSYSKMGGLPLTDKYPFKIWWSEFRMYLLVCSYSLDWKTEKCLEMGWNCQNTLGSSVSYRILRESKCFTLSRFEKWVSWELVCSYSLHSKTGKCLKMGWNCQNTLGSSVSYRILRESKCFTLPRVLIG